MSEQSEISYLDGDIVWVKLGFCWWPGEVVGPEKLPPDLLSAFRKPPIAVVQFFKEDSYEYVKNLNRIFKYNCSRKNEFISKGLDMYRTKHGLMAKFPEDVIRAETAIGGDTEILSREEFQETKKESYASLFGDPRKTPSSSKKGKAKSPDSSKLTTPTRKLKEKSNYKVHILLQGSKTPNVNETVSTPSTSRAGSEPAESLEIPVENKTDTEESKTNEMEKCELPSTPTIPSTPTLLSSGQYACHACQFTTTRLNVLIFHNKTHNISYIPYTPSPIKKKPVHKIPKSTPVTSKTQKARKPRQDKPQKPHKKSQSQKRAAEPEPIPEVKKPKTDVEIKSSLLADWDDGDEESNDEFSATVMARSPEVPVAAESPAVPTPAELPSAQVPEEMQTSQTSQMKSDNSSATEKPESSSDSKYEFCEDEDWPVEADIGRKIPRIKNTSKRKSETKSLSIDDDEMAREVVELLSKTTVPDLPTAPEPLKVEENFPEPSIVKSPDKQMEKLQDQSSPEKTKISDTPPTKTIFKTKTFFRSRHSRSQDAIGKYVAEQLNAAERMDLAESELNGADLTPQLEIRVSPTIEQVKVARLAPKIQLKKMKAEAQLREREKIKEDLILNIYNLKPETNPPNQTEGSENSVTPLTSKIDQDVINDQNHIKTVEKECVDLPKLENIDKQVEIKNDKMNFEIEIKLNEKESLSQDEKSERKPEINDNSVTEQKSETIDNSLIKLKANDLEKPYETYMNESTASAVDALLSVSREADRVTKVISDDPPEDLFEEDIKDTVSSNGLNNVTHTNCQVIHENIDQKITLTDSQSAIVQLCDNVSIQTTQAENGRSPNEREILFPNKESNNIFDSKNVQDTIATDIVSDKTIEQVASHFENDMEVVIHPKNDIEDVSSVPPSNDTMPALVSNDIDKSYPIENTPTESDLQIAEALINLPTTTLQNKSSLDHLEKNLAVSSESLKVHTNENSFEDVSKQNALDVSIPSQQSEIHLSNNDNINSRFETEQEKSENLNAAKSLVQMSETIDHKIKIPEIDQPNTKEILSLLKRKEDDTKLNSLLITKSATEVVTRVSSEVDHKTSNITNECKQNSIVNSSKLLKILEEPSTPKSLPVKKTITKQIIVPGPEKSLNIDVGKSIVKPKSQSPKQKIIIRRTAPNKTLLNNITEVATPDKIILSRTSKPTQDGSPMQTYTIQTTPDLPPTGEGNTIIIQQKIRKISKPMSKLQKIRTPLQTSPVTVVAENRKTNDIKNKDEAMFDINSMPVVLSDDILTPESIEKMPIVMSDGNVITNSNNPPKLIKTKALVENEKVAINSMQTKSEIKTLLMNSTNETSKITTPNILSKSSKLRGAKPMLVIDKVTGKQKIIMTKSETPVKEIKPQTLIQPATQSSAKTEKFIILPTQSSPRPGKTQKIVIDPQTGKAHVLVGKGADPLNVVDNKPVSAKLIPSASDASTPGNTVMIITNAQGNQSRIVLTPEHEKILFPNKQQNVSQLKTVTHRVTSGASLAQKTVVTSSNQIKTQTRIVPKQKSAIITSKGQLIVGGRIATTTQNIAPLPEIRPAPKRILAAEPKKLVQTIQKNSSERLIFLQQKSGAVMQLTAAQFEHLQKTGQIIQKAAPQEKIMVQKSITISPNETGAVPAVPKQRVRKHINDSPTPPKKIKHEISIAPAPVTMPPIPALTPLSNMSSVVHVPSAPSSATATNYSDLDNIEELLPSTAIAKQELRPSQPELIAAPTPPASLSDGQLLAVPGEHFGGPSGSFYLCVEENGQFTVIDNRPLVLENNQLVPMAEPLPVLAQPERRDILEAALANSDVFHAETVRDTPDFRDLNANVSVHCRVSETSTTLNQPIMTPVEVPSKADSEPAMPSTLEDGLAVIGVTPLTVPTSLELPITITDPRIAPKTTDPLSNNNYGPPLLPSPSTETTFTTTEQMEVSVVGPISMPLLTEEDSVGKSMPILTDDVAEKTISSVESTVGSPSSIDVRESENEDSSQWQRRRLTPCSDTSETSAEIPLQPLMQLSVSDISHNS